MIRNLLNMFRNRDVLVSFLFIGVIMIIVTPLRPWLLDLMLIINLGLALIILLTTLFATGPLQFSVFPTLLLATTLFRLALNVASTRLILNSGGTESGAVISAFGNFVVGGNYIVGFVIFIIITVIQFVVITNGAGRVAEVAARFALDAMPGKQMSIDADLNVGLITEQEARRRRAEIQQESDFYGAMDGASKFVKGDAIAGIVITLINLVGGVIIGMVQHRLPAMESLQTFALLTVGDGLVSQIPALLVSTAMGVLVTKASADTSFGRQFTAQIFSFPIGIAMTGVVLFGLGLLPGLPFMPFALLGAAAGYAAILLRNQESNVVTPEPEPAPTSEPQDVLSLLAVSQLDIELGYGLLALADEERGGDLVPRLGSVRRRFMNEIGLYLKPIRVRDNLAIPINQYQILLKGNIIAKGELRPDHYLAMEAGPVTGTVPGISTTDPTFGLQALWISREHKDQAEINGYTVVDCSTVLITHLVEVVKRYSSEILGRQEVKEMLDKLRETHPAVVEDLLNDVTIGELQKVLQQLLAERIPIRDLSTIVETAADSLRIHRDPQQAVEAVRKALARTITNLALQGGDTLRAITLNPHLEQKLLETLQNAGVNQLVMAPEKIEKLLRDLGAALEAANWAGREPVLMCSGRLRPALRKLTLRHFPSLHILAVNEVLPDVPIEVIGIVAQ